MLDDLLKEVVVHIVGAPGQELAPLLHSKKHVNEFNIAKKMDLTINQVRNLLYRIADHGLVSSERKKDNKKGWYTYFWKLDVLKSLRFLREKVNNKVEQTRNLIKSRESKKFYVCERCGVEVSEENALLYDFTCDECGDLFTVKDDTKLLKGLRKRLTQLEKKLEEIDNEIEKERQRLEKSRKRSIAARKSKEKAARKKRAAERKASKKKTTKKKTSKKTTGKKKTTKKKSTGKSSKKKSSSKKSSGKKSKKSSKK